MIHIYHNYCYTYYNLLSLYISIYIKGDTHLGGEDFDQRMMDHCMSTFKKKHGLDVAGDNKAIARIRRQCEMAKRTLSTQMSAQIEVRI